MALVVILAALAFAQPGAQPDTAPIAAPWIQFRASSPADTPVPIRIDVPAEFIGEESRFLVMSWRGQPDEWAGVHLPSEQLAAFGHHPLHDESLTPTHWVIGSWNDNCVLLPWPKGVSNPTLHLRLFPMDGRGNPLPEPLLWHQDCRFETTVVESIDEVMEPADSTQVAMQLQSLPIHVHMDRAQKRVALDLDVAARSWPADLTVALRIEVKVNDALVGIGRVWWRGTDTGVQPGGGVVPIAGDIPAMINAVSPSIWRIELTPDPQFALRDVESSRFWDGPSIARPGDEVSFHTGP